jgi:hypothetical protein
VIAEAVREAYPRQAINGWFVADVVLDALRSAGLLPTPEGREGRYKEALEYIAGCFVGDERKTYGHPAVTMDRIRDRARAALSQDTEGGEH